MEPVQKKTTKSLKDVGKLFNIINPFSSLMSFNDALNGLLSNILVMNIKGIKQAEEFTLLSIGILYWQGQR